MVTPLVGLALLIFVFFTALNGTPGGEMSFFNMHAFVVVVGGTIGALCLAIDRRSLLRMVMTARDILPFTNKVRTELRSNRQGLEEIRKAWREGRRSVILDMADHGATAELRTAATALLNKLSGPALTEAFGELKGHYVEQMQPTAEGWDIVNRLAPSFGMVGTVAGMVQLFRNMNSEAGNLGGAMAMALLATLYGIAIGAAVGGPMTSRINNQLNERLGSIDLLEQLVAALVEEERQDLKQARV